MTYFDPTRHSTGRSMPQPRPGYARAASRVPTGLGLSLGALVSLGLWAALIHMATSLLV